VISSDIAVIVTKNLGIVQIVVILTLVYLAIHISRDSGATNAVCLTAADKLRLSLQRDVVA
jgi:hypothetical protein